MNHDTEHRSGNPKSNNSEHHEDPTTGNPSAAGKEISEAEIRERAYEIYLARGGVDGLDENDWFQAEKELRNGLKTEEKKA
jgi:hypothetical protein